MLKLKIFVAAVVLAFVYVYATPGYTNSALFLAGLVLLYLLSEQRAHVKKEILKRNHKTPNILGGF